MKTILKGIFLVLSVNLILNIWVLSFAGKIAFNQNYWGNHHFFQDARSVGGDFNLLRAWGQTDSQWYMKIAAKGYGKDLKFVMDKNEMTGLSYAFFPLYPLLIKMVSVFTSGNYEIAAFLL